MDFRGPPGKMIYLCPFLTLLSSKKKKNLTRGFKPNMIGALASSIPPPFSAAGNKSCCNYQAGSISHIAPLPHLQWTLTCSSLSASRRYRSVTDRRHSVPSLHTTNVQNRDTLRNMGTSRCRGTQTGMRVRCHGGIGLSCYWRRLLS